MRAKLITILRVVVTTVLFAYLVHKTGLFNSQGRQAFVTMIAAVSLPLLLASVGVGLLSTLSRVFKWYMLLRSRRITVGFGNLFIYYLVGRFFSKVLPTTIGGDVMRMHLLGVHTGQHADAAASIFVDRFIGLGTLIMLATLTVVTNFRMFNLPWLMAIVGMYTTALGLIWWMIISPRPFKTAERLLCRGSRGKILGKVFSEVENIQKAVLLYKDDPMALLVAVLNSLVFYFIAVLNVWVSALVFGSTLDFFTVLALIPVILFIMNLPISIGDFGLMESGIAFTFGLVGAPPALAAATALLMRARSFFFAGIGGLLYLLIANADQLRKELPATSRT